MSRPSAESIATPSTWSPSASSWARSLRSSPTRAAITAWSSENSSHALVPVVTARSARSPALTTVTLISDTGVLLVRGWTAASIVSVDPGSSPSGFRPGQRLHSGQAEPAHWQPTLGGGTMRHSVTLALALVITLIAAAAAADTSSFPDRRDLVGRHDIVKVVVDNTGTTVGVSVVHHGARWKGSVRLALDTVGGPRPEYVAVVSHGHPRGATIRRSDGLPWRCPSGKVRSPLGQARHVAESRPRLSRRGRHTCRSGSGRRAPAGARMSRSPRRFCSSPARTW